MPDQCYLSWNSIRVWMTEWLQYSENIELGLLNKQISSNFLFIQKQFVDLPTEADSMLRRGMERYLVAAVLGRCLVPVRVSQAEYSAVVQRSRRAMRSLRQILAKVATA